MFNSGASGAGAARDARQTVARVEEWRARDQGRSSPTQLRPDRRKVHRMQLAEAMDGAPGADRRDLARPVRPAGEDAAAARAVDRDLRPHGPADVAERRRRLARSCTACCRTRSRRSCGRGASEDGFAEPVDREHCAYVFLLRDADRQLLGAVGTDLPRVAQRRRSAAVRARAGPAAAGARVPAARAGRPVQHRRPAAQPDRARPRPRAAARRDARTTPRAAIRPTTSRSSCRAAWTTSAARVGALLIPGQEHRRVPHRQGHAAARRRGRAHAHAPPRCSPGRSCTARR